jgi:hypothetical protein
MLHQTPKPIQLISTFDHTLKIRSPPQNIQGRRKVEDFLFLCRTPQTRIHGWGLFRRLKIFGDGCTPKRLAWMIGICSRKEGLIPPAAFTQLPPMIDAQDARNAFLALPEAEESQPFGPDAMVYNVKVHPTATGGAPSTRG